MLVKEIIGVFTGATKRQKRRHVVTGTVLGLFTGAVAGILFAPKSGKETRKDVADFAVKGAGVVKEKAVHLYEKSQDVASVAAEKVGDWTTQVKEKISDVTSDAAKAARKAARDARRHAAKVSRAVADVVDPVEEDHAEDVHEKVEE